jgi:hypothetical protein
MGALYCGVGRDAERVDDISMIWRQCSEDDLEISVFKRKMVREVGRSRNIGMKRLPRFCCSEWLGADLILSSEYKACRISLRHLAFHETHVALSAINHDLSSSRLLREQ